MIKLGICLKNPVLCWETRFSIKVRSITMLSAGFLTIPRRKAPKVYIPSKELTHPLCMEALFESMMFRTSGFGGSHVIVSLEGNIIPLKKWCLGGISFRNGPCFEDEFVHFRGGWVGGKILAFAFYWWVSWFRKLVVYRDFSEGSQKKSL